DEAANSAFAFGRIAFDAENDFEGATRWFETYLFERPRGPLAREALGRTLEALLRSHDARARTTAHTYLAQYPDGPHAPIARAAIADELPLSAPPAWEVER